MIPNTLYHEKKLTQTKTDNRLKKHLIFLSSEGVKHVFARLEKIGKTTQQQNLLSRLDN